MSEMSKEMRKELKDIYEILNEICTLLMGLHKVLGSYERGKFGKLTEKIEEKIRALSKES